MRLLKMVLVVKNGQEQNNFLNKKYLIMKFFSIQFILLLSLITLSAKAQRKCGSDVDIEYIRLNYPEQFQRILDFNREANDYKNALATRGAEEIIVIPVVVHVLWNTPQQNISDALIHSQIAVLNEDFNRLNADAINTPSEFADVASNPKFRFRLACRDPFGSPTSGIIRKFTRVESFSSFNKPKQIQSSEGENQFVGSDPWRTDKYLNIWVCNIEATIRTNRGYIPALRSTEFIDGVLMHYEGFGRDNNLPLANYKLGRTCTHEVGHWLNCYHIYQGNSCSGDGDFCADTPPQNGANQNCPSFPHFSCPNQPNGDMFMNFMDASVDVCLNLFTNDQKNRMRALFEPNSFRRSIIENNDALNQVTRNYVPQNGSNTIVLKKKVEGQNDIGSTSLTYTPVFVDDCQKTGNISWRLVSRNAGADISINGESVSLRLTRASSKCEIEVTIPTSLGAIIENYSFYVYLPVPHYTLSPNPATSTLTIEQRLNPNDALLLETPYDVTIVSTFNQPVKKGKGNNGRTDFNVSDLPRGLYEVLIASQGQVISKRLMVQR
jgi:Pregnancy-associated plasma protein-A/Secretion system C-terminal sorting domain